MRPLEGRVAIVTGAGRGLGRAEAIALAAEGAAVVVDDVGAALDGAGRDASPAQAVVEEIRAAGGEAIASHEDVSDWEGARRLVEQAVRAYGRLDVLVNNAGILRDRMSFNMDEAEWDSVIRVHLKGHFAPARHALAHWREVARRAGPVDAAIVNTTSESGLYGYAAHANYATAKGGIAAMTIALAREAQRLGVRVNAIAPVALTRLTQQLASDGLIDADDHAAYAPENAAAMVCWLASPRAAGVTGQVFKVRGGVAQVVRGWRPLAPITSDRRPWTSDALAARRDALLAGEGPGLPPSYGPD